MRSPPAIAVLALGLAVAGCGGGATRPLQAEEQAAATKAVRARLTPPARYAWKPDCLGAVAGCYFNRAPIDDLSRGGVGYVLSKFGVERGAIDRCVPLGSHISCGAYGEVGRYGVAITFLSGTSTNPKLSGTKITFDAVRVRR